MRIKRFPSSGGIHHLSERRLFLVARFRGATAVLLLCTLLAAESARPLPYVVKKNDTLWGVAERFGVTVEQIRNANPKIIDPDLVFAGDRILIPNPSTPSQESVAQATFLHEIGPGETLARIASKYGVTVEALLAANPGIRNPDLIYANETLKVPGAPTSAQAAAGARETASQTIQHEIKPGENLTRIAKAYEVTVADLLSLNPRIKNQNLIYAQESLTVPYARLPVGTSLARREDGRVRVVRPGARPGTFSSVQSQFLRAFVLLYRSSPDAGARASREVFRLLKEGKTEQEAYAAGLDIAKKELSRRMNEPVVTDNLYRYQERPIFHDYDGYGTERPPSYETYEGMLNYDPMTRYRSGLGRSTFEGLGYRPPSVRSRFTPRPFR